jgi:hypothetical protein
MHVCMYMYTYIYEMFSATLSRGGRTGACMCVYVCLCICVFTRVCALHNLLCVFICVCVCERERECVCTYMYEMFSAPLLREGACLCVCVFMYMHMHVHL